MASKTWLKRKASERKSEEAEQWVRPRVARNRAYIAPKKRKFELRPEIRHIPKPLASRYYQLMSGHALIGPYMKEKLKKADSDECWWCDTGQRQTRENLFKECPKWKDEIRDLWRDVRKAVGWPRPRWKPISLFFRTEKATEAILALWKVTGVGKMPGREAPEEYGDGREDEDWSEEED
jgi:hypothetical protein